jgi:hypothetical protein
MRIAEILNWNNDPAEKVRPDPQPDLSSVPFNDDLTNLADAFTWSGLVKHGWNFQGSEGQPSGPAPPDFETELIPNGTLEPTTASWQADAVETEPSWVRIGSFRIGNSAAGQPPTRQPALHDNRQ